MVYSQNTDEMME